jgi:hypothetical protein
VQGPQACPGFASAAAPVFVVSLMFELVLQFPIVCGLLQGQAGVVLELPHQKAQGFLVLIALIWLFLEYARKVFGEIPVGT